MGINVTITQIQEGVLNEIADQYTDWVASETRARQRGYISSAIKWPSIVATHDADRGNIVTTLLEKELLERVGNDLVMTPAAWAVLKRKEPSVPKLAAPAFDIHERVVSKETGRIYKVENITVNASTGNRHYLIAGVNGQYTLTDNGMKSKMQHWMPDTKI